jgi:hypothetical protein
MGFQGIAFTCIFRAECRLVSCDMLTVRSQLALLISFCIRNKFLLWASRRGLADGTSLAGWPDKCA